MNSPDSETSESQKLELRTLEGWTEFYRNTAVFDASSGLMVLTTRKAAFAALGAPAEVLMQYGLYNGEGTPRFDKTVLLLPPGSGFEELRQECIATMQNLMAEEKVNGLVIKLLPAIVDFRASTTLEATRLLEAVKDIPRNSACTIFSAELYRYADLENENTSARYHPAQDIASRHLEHLVRELSLVAIQNQLMILLFCDERAHGDTKLEPHEYETFAFFELVDKRPEQTAVDVSAFIEPFRAGGWPSVRAVSLFTASAAEKIAFRLWEVFAQSGDHTLAWHAIEPYVLKIDQFDGKTQLAMATCAHSAEDWEASSRLLKASWNEGLDNAEELSTALSLADSLHIQDLFDKALEKLRQTYPENVLTLQAEYRALFRSRKFSEASKLADQLGWPLEVSLCRSFASPFINANVYLSEMEAAGQRDRGLITCAEEALYRRRFCQSIDWARHIQEQSPLFGRSCVVRFRALRTAFRRGNKAYSVQELENLMRIVAKLPGNNSLRGELERLLDHHIEEPLVRATISQMLVKLLEQQALRDDQSIEQARALQKGLNQRPGAHTEEELTEFQELFLNAMFSAQKNTWLGEGQLDPVLIKYAGAALARATALAIVNEGLRSELDPALVCLHGLCLVCNETGDPSSDFEALRGIIEYQASVGASQVCRDLAETALQFWPKAQPVFLSWRIRQGWAALAEACARSGNSMAALRYLVLGVLAHESPALSTEQLRHSYRLAARVLRDLGQFDLAAPCIELEKSLLSKLKRNDQAIPLEVLELQVCLPAVMASSDEDMLLEALKHSEELAGKGESSEEFALAGIQASILRLLPSDKIPADILGNFRGRLAGIPEPLHGKLKGAAAKNPTKEDIAAIITALPEAQDHHYLAYQIAPSLPALSNAVRYAVISQDSELFFLAAAPFAQPSLGVKVAASPQQPPAQVKPSSVLLTTTLEGRNSGTLENVPQYSFASLADVSLSQLQNILTPKTETALVIACEPSDRPMSLLVCHDSISLPHEIESWSIDSFSKWRVGYMYTFEWHEPKKNIIGGFIPGLDQLEPPIDEVQAFVKGLSIGLSEIPSVLTIIPPSHLFGFTWNLSPISNGFLCEQTRVAVAPSAAWIVAARSEPWAGKARRRAWIGSSETKDTTLIAHRADVEECLQEHKFDVSRANGPFNFQNCEIVYIGAHGGTGVGDYFRSVGDRINDFSPEELAQMLGGCGCVILAVCSGGRSDRQAGSSETLGLVSSLFRAGVRCVLAAPWPLDISVVKHWLPAFLERMEQGEAVGEAAIRAQQAVRARYDHPYAWGQMHVYGDQNFSVTPAQKPPVSL